MKHPCFRYAVALLTALLLALICCLPLLMPSADNADPSGDGNAATNMLLDFVSNGDGTCYVAGMGACTDTDLVIPSLSPSGDTVTAIEKYAFFEHTELTSLTLPETLIEIGTKAFYGCTSIAALTLPQGVRSIHNGAFGMCESLTALTLPASLTHLGVGAFHGCIRLESFRVAGGNPVYHSTYNCIIETQSRTLVSGCRASVIPDDGSVARIGMSAFAYCTTVYSMEIPTAVEVIEQGAFMGCTALSELFLSEGLTEIERSAFAGCISLERLVIPASVKHIHPSVFESCTSLAEIVLKNTSGWYADSHRFTSRDLVDPKAAASLMCGQFLFNHWTRG